jgi:hypothetical protein
MEIEATLRTQFFSIMTNSMSYLYWMVMRKWMIHLTLPLFSITYVCLFDHGLEFDVCVARLLSLEISVRILRRAGVLGGGNYRK